MKRLFSVLVAALLIAPTLALAQGRPGYYELNPPLAVETEGKIEVIEFFRYGCNHCYNLQPLIEPWIKKLPPEVQFRRIPAVFNNRREAHDAAIFYTFEALGVLPKVHRAFFDAIHRDRLLIENPEVLSQWLQKQGIDEKKFAETFKSFGVQSKTKRAAQLTAAYKIDGTPAMGVDGRYTVPVAESHARMLETVSQIVEKLRKSK